MLSATASVLPSGGPGRGAVVAAEVRHDLRGPLGEVLHDDDRLLLVERHVRDAAAVRRPRGRHDRLARGEHRLRVEPVGIGHLQLVAAGALHHVGDLGAEHALVAGEALVDHVGDAMRGGAKLRRRDEVRVAGELRLLGHVEQAEAHFDAPVGLRLDLADHERLGAARGPLVGLDLRGLGGRRARGELGHQLEEAGARQVGAHDGAHRLRLRGLVGHRHERDRDLPPAAGGDVDGELRVRRRGEQQRHEGEKGSRKHSERPASARAGNRG